ncbi:MAG: hypothetical protein QXR57_05415 [Metallosphaera sp.]|uniref:Uncharacterized protein n=1 Tax=Metallosphaera cuprina (strain Ar-4) TaxID=1006006 RepID=F4G277_METCR|nr:hypothetical protein [Metallosphaera cuprina]AEB94925.1 conserved hypothetical protein [Metallosphaera cuprina Ar-4]
MGKLNLADLKSLDKTKREEAWRTLEAQLASDYRPLLKYRLFLRSLLWSNVQGVREQAWEHLPLYKRLSVKGIERTFSHRSERVRLTAWQNYTVCLELGIVNKAQLLRLKQHFWRLLRSYYPTVKKRAWRLIPSLVDHEIITSRDSERIINFLRYGRANVRIMAWYYSSYLLERRVLSREQLEDSLTYLRDLTNFESNISRKAKRILKSLES